jgi:hypothetical protein
MQQKFMVTLIPYSQHVSAIHGHHQVSVTILNCCTVLHVATYRYSLIKIKIRNLFQNRPTLLNLIKPVNSSLLMRPISAIFSGVGVFVFRVVRGVGAHVDFSYICPFGCRPSIQLV